MFLMIDRNFKGGTYFENFRKEENCSIDSSIRLIRDISRLWRQGK